MDFLLQAGNQRIPMKVKYQLRIDAVRDTEDITTFVEEPCNHAPFGLFIAREDPPPIDDQRVVAMPLSTFMPLG